MTVVFEKEKDQRKNIHQYLFHIKTFVLNKIYFIKQIESHTQQFQKRFLLIIIYQYHRISMGNTLQEQKQIARVVQQEASNYKKSNARISTVNSFQRNTYQPQSPIIKTSVSQHHNSRISKSFDGKVKQKLSLSKQVKQQCNQRVRPHLSAPKDRRTNNLSLNNFNFSARPSEPVYPSPKFIANGPKIIYAQPNSQSQKTILRPKDLPRKISTEKFIIFPKQSQIRQPQRPMIIVTPPPNSSPCINIAFSRPIQRCEQSISLQSSIVTPFIPSGYQKQQSSRILYNQTGKKLKKVAMNRSFATNIDSYTGENNGQDHQSTRSNKQNDKKLKFDFTHQSLPVQSTPRPETLYTDPNLYSYITNKQHPCLNQLQKKKCVAKESLDQKKVVRQHSNIFTNRIQRLQEAISSEVQSKPLIEGQFFKTLTDFSEDSKMDNTSFIPITCSNSSDQYGLHGQELLRYCQPKIDQKVLADVLNLKFRP